MRICNFLFVGVLAISPLTSVLAQGTGPDLKADSTREATDVKNGSGTNPHQAGVNGSTATPGNNSTDSANRKGTADGVSGGGGK